MPSPLRLVERLERHDLGHDRVAPDAFGHGLVAGLHRRRPLRLVVGQNDRAVLRAAVIALAIGRRRVVDAPEDGQDILVVNYRRVIPHLDDLSVARPLAAHLLIGRVGHVAAGVAGDDARHAGHVAVDGVETPETAAAQRRDFELLVTHLFHLFLWENGTTDYANL